MEQVKAYFFDSGRGTTSTRFAVNKNSVFKQNSKKQKPKTYLKYVIFWKKKL